MHHPMKENAQQKYLKFAEAHDRFRLPLFMFSALRLHHRERIVELER